MNKRFFYFVVTVITIMFFVACNKFDVVTVHGECTREIDNDTVKAIIRTYKQYSDDKDYWIVYEIASVKYENGEFELNELNFPESIPDEYLETVTTIPEYLFPIFEIEDISDIQAKIGLVEIYANNNAGNYNGSFYLCNDEWWAIHLYADRSFTVKGSDKYGTVVDCSFEKGWNIKYNSQKEHTSQKPLNEDFRWWFKPLCSD